ncbi:unnamed protein product, partial [Staurois parvus]
MNVTVDNRCGDTEGDITNVSNIDSNVIDNVCIVDGNVGNANNECDIHDETKDAFSVLVVTPSAVQGAVVQSLGAEQRDGLDRPVPCPGSEDCALISAQPSALHRTRQPAGTCSSTPQAALK